MGILRSHIAKAVAEHKEGHLHVLMAKLALARLAVLPEGNSTEAPPLLTDLEAVLVPRLTADDPRCG